MDILYLMIIGFAAIAAVIIIIWFISKQQRSRVEIVEEQERGRRTPREIIPFDEEAAEVLERRIVRCSNCDEEVSPYDEECPHCGARLSAASYECSNCGEEVDPREKECPHCGEILLPDPYVCPNCQKPVEEDSTKCDYCGARYWSPILLDERSMKNKHRRNIPPLNDPVEEKEKVSDDTRRTSRR